MENNPSQELAEEIEIARKLFAGHCEFIAGTTTVDRLPDTQYNEVAFAGRSNVGKSSLINALTNRNSLARTSKTPGRTQQINFFNLSDAFLLVDLPGYGYAKASKKIVNDWNKLIRSYLRGRQQLRRVYMLIDSRHGIKPVDLETMTLLDESAMSYQIVLTKIDKISQAELHSVYQSTIDQIKRRVAAHPEVIKTSSEKNLGFDTLRYEIYKLCCQ